MINKVVVMDADWAWRLGSQEYLTEKGSEPVLWKSEIWAFLAVTQQPETREHSGPGRTEGSRDRDKG